MGFHVQFREQIVHPFGIKLEMASHTNAFTRLQGVCKGEAIQRTWLTDLRRLELLRVAVMQSTK